MHDQSRDGQPDSDGDDFRFSLDQMLDRVTAAARDVPEAWNRATLSPHSDPDTADAAAASLRTAPEPVDAATASPRGDPGTADAALPAPARRSTVERVAAMLAQKSSEAAARRGDEDGIETTRPDMGPFVPDQADKPESSPPSSTAARPSDSASAAASPASGETSGVDDEQDAIAPAARAPAPSRERSAVPDPAPRHASPSQRRHGVRLAAAVGALVVAAVAWLLPFRPSPVTTATVALAGLPPPSAGPRSTTAPSTPPAAAAAAQVPVAIDPDSSTESSMLEELGRAVGVGDVALSATAAAEVPRIAVARYDTLSSEPAGWRIVAPLNAEEVYALVRADSPLRYLHELRQRRIDVGPAGSARARSADAFYRSMFGAPLPARAAVALPRDAALQRLLAGGDIDALLLFDGQPSRWLMSLPVDTRRRLRLLSLAPGNAASRRALQVYLPATVDALAADGARTPVATLGVLSFLVAGPDARDVGLVARSLCDGLPALRRHGHPKWHEVQLSLRLPAGLPEAPEATAALDACTAVPPSRSSQPTLPGARS